MIILHEIDKLGDSIYEEPEENSKVDYAVAGLYDVLEHAEPRNILLILIGQKLNVFSPRTLSRLMFNTISIPQELPIKMRKCILKQYLSKEGLTLEKKYLFELAKKTQNHSALDLQKYIESHTYSRDLQAIAKEEQEKKDLLNRRIVLLCEHAFILTMLLG